MQNGAKIPNQKLLSLKKPPIIGRNSEIHIHERALKMVLLQYFTDTGNSIEIHYLSSPK
jgi:hypothetical protein